MHEISPQMLAAFEDELEKVAFHPALRQAVRASPLVAQVGRGLRSAGGSIADFGKRQLHSVTGWTPKGQDATTALRQMGGGATPALQRVEKARASLATGGKGAARELESAKKHLSAAQEVESLGANSIPGYLKSLATKPVQTISSGVRESWHGSGTGVMGHVGRGATFGLPAAAAASEALRPSGEGEKGRLERTGRALGGLAFGVTSMPLTGATMIGSGITSGAGLVGRGLDRLKKTPGAEGVGT